MGVRRAVRVTWWNRRKKQNAKKHQDEFHQKELIMGNIYGGKAGNMVKRHAAVKND